MTDSTSSDGRETTPTLTPVTDIQGRYQERQAQVTRRIADGIAERNRHRADIQRRGLPMESYDGLQQLLNVREDWGFLLGKTGNRMPAFRDEWLDDDGNLVITKYRFALALIYNGDEPRLLRAILMGEGRLPRPKNRQRRQWRRGDSE